MNTRPDNERTLKRLKELNREYKTVAHIGAVLGWDQETYMPPAAIEDRAEQMAFIEALAHEKITRPEIGRLLAGLGSTDANPLGDEGLDPIDRAFLRALKRTYDRNTKLPSGFVSDKAKATSKSQAAWAKAKKANDFGLFLPHLSAMVDFAKKEASFLNPNGRPYDVLLDLYEPGLTVAELDRVFGKLKSDLVGILGEIRSTPQVEASFLSRPCPETKQEVFCQFIMRELGYEIDKGRLDRTAHPFSTTLGGNDKRITTRYIENFFPTSVFSVIHETGHALYEMGIDPANNGTELGEGASTAMHESQSRFWENVVGRSRDFWERYFPVLKATLAPALEGIGVEAFYRAANKVAPSLIRTEADEVTYGLHVILRFNLEKRLISGDLSAKDVPNAWNSEMMDLLGIVPPTDTEGCLQDIHWSMGAIGYFPSYSLGNLYAAQFSEKLAKDIPDYSKDIAAGRFGTVLGWLRGNIHVHGSIYTPSELIRRVTGDSLDPSCFVRYLRKKYSEVYGF